MECFNHSGKMSVALCKNCYKGLCQECCKPQSGLHFSCREVCNEQANLENQIREWSGKFILNKKSARHARHIALVFIILGLTILGPEFYGNLVYGNKVFIPMVALGVAMFLAALISYKGMPK